METLNLFRFLVVRLFLFVVGFSGGLEALLCVPGSPKLCGSKVRLRLTRCVGCFESLSDLLTHGLFWNYNISLKTIS